MNKTYELQLGVVGFGRIVELVHLPLLKLIPEIHVQGVFDVTPERRGLAEKRGFLVFQTLVELLESSIEAILIATPPSSHYQLAVQALEKGKHVIIEKPITVNAQEAMALDKLAKMYGKTITVFHNRRFDGDFLLVQQMISEGLLGEILFLERRHHMFGSGAFFGVKSFNPLWRNENQYGGGALMDWGVHLVDQLLILQLGNVSELSALTGNLRWNQSEAEDYVQAHIRLDNGILMLMSVNFGSAAAAPLWIVGGDKATLQILSDKEAYLCEKGKPPKPIQIPITERYAGKEIYQTFVSQINGSGELAVNLAEVIDTMTLLDAIRYSALSKKGIEYGDFILSTTSGI